MNTFALRARRILTLADTAPALRRTELSAPLTVLDNAVLVIRAGLVAAVESHADFKRRTGVPLRDAGEVTLLPGLLNAHCHLELSSLRNRTVLGQGFAVWVQSLLALKKTGALKKEALAEAAEETAAHGIVHVGDVNSEAPVNTAGAFFAAGVGADFFLECFGFAPADEKELEAERLKDVPPDLRPHCALSGHALFSTHPRTLQSARNRCLTQSKTFALHLAEHDEEVDCLLHGRGPLCELLRARGILPEGWAPPGKRPIALARALGLLGPSTLAVHCVHCDAEEAALLAQTQTNVCLCPRSNAAIGVGGEAPADRLIDAGVCLCLGTDSLASNADLNLWNEARALRGRHDLPDQALIRMMTVNAAHALCRPETGALTPGRRAAWAVLPEDFQPSTRYAL